MPPPLSLAERLDLLDQASATAPADLLANPEGQALMDWCAVQGVRPRDEPRATPAHPAASRPLVLMPLGLSLLALALVAVGLAQVPGLQLVLHHAAIPGLDLPMRGCLP